jgi:hypothetical protein
LEVSRWLGHTSVKITADTYGHLTEAVPDRLRGIIDAALGELDDLGKRTISAWTRPLKRSPCWNGAGSPPVSSS